MPCVAGRYENLLSRLRQSQKPPLAPTSKMDNISPGWIASVPKARHYGCSVTPRQDLEWLFHTTHPVAQPLGQCALSFPQPKDHCAEPAIEPAKGRDAHDRVTEAADGSKSKVAGPASHRKNSGARSPAVSGPANN